MRLAIRYIKVLVLGTALGLYLLAGVGSYSHIIDDRTAEAMPLTDDSPLAKAERLLNQHDCWTGQSPYPSLIPGHVVVTTREGVTAYRGSRSVEAALQQLFENKDYGLTVHGFCV